MIANQTLFNPAQLVLELNETVIAQAWQQSQTMANAQSRWQHYLNQVALSVILPWIQGEEDDTAKVGLDSATQADLWEVVNGAVVNISGAKLVLIPSEAEDLEELRVPQEWIDIPELVADYYLGVQVNVDAGYIRVWGYTTHQQLKNKAEFNQGDRTYSMAEDELINDINALWVARELCPEELTQVKVETIAAISSEQAEQLITRLGRQNQLIPRLAIPFSTWAALIQNHDWLNSLAVTRRGDLASKSTNVIEWLKKGIDNLTTTSWRQIEMTPSIGGARGIAVQDATTLNNIPAFGLAKQIVILSQPYELRILPLSETGSWRFELCCITPGCNIPQGFKLRLLTAELETFAGNEDVSTEPVEQLFLEVDLDKGESLVCQIEPTPDNYQTEVLQF